MGKWGYEHHFPSQLAGLEGSILRGTGRANSPWGFRQKVKSLDGHFDLGTHYGSCHTILSQMAKWFLHMPPGEGMAENFQTPFSRNENPLNSYVTLDKLFKLSEPQFSYLENRDTMNTSLIIIGKLGRDWGKQGLGQDTTFTGDAM